MLSLFRKNKPATIIDARQTEGTVVISAPTREKQVALVTLWAWGDKRIRNKPPLADRLTFGQLMSQKDAEQVLFG